MRCRTWVLFSAVFGLVVLASFTTGCGGSSSDNANIRLVNATPDENGLDLLIDTNSVITGVGYGSASAYNAVGSGSRHLQVEPTGTDDVLIDVTPSLASGGHFSLVTLNFHFNISSLLLTDDNSAPSSGNFRLRVINASPGMGTQDVYVVPAGTDISSVDPTFPSLAFGSASAYLTLAAGSYQIIFAPVLQKFGNLDTGSLSFSAGQVRTVLGLNNPGGAYEASVLSDVN